MDDMDRAQAREQLDTGFALQAQQAKLGKLNIPKKIRPDGTEICWGCDEPIPPERLKSHPEARHCVPCLEEIERRTTWFWRK